MLNQEHKFNLFWMLSIYDMTCFKGHHYLAKFEDRGKYNTENVFH
jgi:hypothetical protein